MTAIGAANPTSRDVPSPDVQPRATQDAPNLDLLRTTAVSFVVVSHLLPAVGLPELPHYHLQALGLLGVAMFFVHTSLVLMFSLERQRARSTGGSGYFTFVVRRVFRIYPLSVITVLATLGLSLEGLGQHFEPTGRLLAANLLLVQNFTHDVSMPPALWSLPYEMQMYLVLPFLFLLARPQTRASVRAFLALWVLAVAAVLVAWRLHIEYTLIKYIPDFLPGVLAYALWSRRVHLPSVTLPLGLAALGLVFPILVKHGVPESLLAMPVCLGLGLLLPQIRETTNRAVGAVTKTIAKYSYGIYLFHGPAIWFAFMRAGTTPMALRVAEFVVLVVALPWAAYHALEHPMIQAGGRVAAKLHGR